MSEESVTDTRAALRAATGGGAAVTETTSGTAVPSAPRASDDGGLDVGATAGATPDAASTSFGTRLEFLDALRGLAAMLVVVEHISEQQWTAFQTFALERFRFGEFGVVVFFMISGFIIPASLERRGSLREFWIGRVFRLFPIYWATIVAILVLHFGFHRYRGIDFYWPHWARYTAYNATMVQNFFTTRMALGQSWTLAYEMTFYVAVSILFVGGVHRRTAPIAAIGLLVAMVVANPGIPHPLAHDLNAKVTAALVVMIVLALGAAAYLSRGKGPVTTSLCMLFAALCAVGLANRYEPAFQAAFFLGTMFFGNAVYRWTKGSLSGRTLGLLSILAFVSIVVAQSRNWSPWLSGNPVQNGRFHMAEVLTYGGAYATFFVGVLLRDKHFPKPLLYLGTISYSLYLVHAIALYAGPEWPAHKTWTVLAQIALTIVLSALTYQFIEKPAIALGRKVAKATRPKHRGSAAPPSPPRSPAGGGVATG